MRSVDGQSAFGPVGAEGADRHGDQSLIDGPEALQVDGDRSRLDHHVSRGAQPLERGLTAVSW